MTFLMSSTESVITETYFDATCDQILIPALEQIRSDHDTENLTEADANHLFAMIGGLMPPNPCPH